MMSKILYWTGLIACITLIISCFLPWAYYSDLHKTFNGFFSEQNNYGRPGMLLVPLAIIIFIFMLLPKLWAKRANLFICALLVGYALTKYILFTSSYGLSFPEKRFGIFLMLFSSIVMLIASIFPRMETIVTKPKN